MRAAEQSAQGLAEGKVHSYETLATLNIETRVFAASDADASSSSSSAAAAAAVAGVTPNMKASRASASTPHSRKAVSLDAEGEKGAQHGPTVAAQNDGRRQDHVLTSGPERPRRAFRVRGAAQTRSPAS